MEPSRTRIVVVATGGALATRLTLAEPTWDVEHVADCADVRWVDGFNGAVVDTSSGLIVDCPDLDSLTERCGRVVLLGEEDDVPDGVVVLAPPFELRDLVEALGGEVPPEGIEIDPAAPRPRRFRRRGAGEDVVVADGRGKLAKPSLRVAAVSGTPSSSPIMAEALRPRVEPPAPLPARPMSAHRFGERVERALLAMDEVHSLLGEVPTLADVGAIGSAIVEEIRTEVRATTVCVFCRTPDGLIVIDGVGLEGAEAETTVPIGHVFLRALADRQNAAYFERHGDGAAIVAGVPGATTPFVAVAPMRRDATMIGLLLVGADTIDGSVTRMLDRITREAAPALALALAIHAFDRS